MSGDPASASHWIDVWPPESEFEGETFASSVQPLMAYSIWWSLTWLSQLWDKAAVGNWSSVHEVDDDELVDLLLDDLPHIARRWVPDPEFCKRMAASAVWLSDQVVLGIAGDHVARCTADEINLHLAFRKTELIFDDSDPPVPELQAASHFDADERRHWVDNAQEALLRDVDVEWLWKPEKDGVEENDVLLTELGMAPMRVSEWFEPFGGVEIEPPAVPHPSDYGWRRK